MATETRETKDGIDYKVGGYWLGEREVCHSCLDERLAENMPPKEAFVQSCGGIYAGKSCDECFKKNYKQDWRYDYLDAGEHYGPDDY